MTMQPNNNPQPQNPDPRTSPANTLRKTSEGADAKLLSPENAQSAATIMGIYARLGHLVVGATAGTAMVGGSVWALVQFFSQLIGE